MSCICRFRFMSLDAIRWQITAMLVNIAELRTFAVITAMHILVVIAHVQFMFSTCFSVSQDYILILLIILSCPVYSSHFKNAFYGFSAE